MNNRFTVNSCLICEFVILLLDHLFLQVICDSRPHMYTKQTGDVHSRLVQCWPRFCHDGPTSDQPYLACFVEANTRHRPNVGPLLGHRLRRWPNNGPTLGRCLVFLGGCVRASITGRHYALLSEHEMAWL